MEGRTGTATVTDVDGEGRDDAAQRPGARPWLLEMPSSSFPCVQGPPVDSRGEEVEEGWTGGRWCRGSRSRSGSGWVVWEYVEWTVGGIVAALCVSPMLQLSI